MKCSEQNLLKAISNDLDKILDFSFKEPAPDFGKLYNLFNNHKNTCWEEKQCNHSSCSAYNNNSARCWMISKPHCCGEKKENDSTFLDSCKKCRVFKKTVFKNLYSEIQEKLFIILYKDFEKQSELNRLATQDF